MNKKLFSLALLSLLIMAGCDKGETPQAKAEPSTGSASANVQAPAARTANDTALAVIETDAYEMKVHRAIPFRPKADPLGMFKLPDGYQYIVLDLSVRNKSNEPLEMGSILLVAKVTDEAGKALEGNMAALTAYTVENPDPRQDTEYDEVWSVEFKPGAVHRAIALGMQAPSSTRTLIFAVPAKAGGSKDFRQVKFQIGERQ